MSRLELYFLGSPRVCIDAVTVQIERRKVMALLAYLAVTGRPHTRDELAELLYGQQDVGRARGNLRQTLSLLRQAIGAERLGADRLNVWLPDSDTVWHDVDEYVRLAESGRQSDSRGDLAAASGHLAAAVDLYRGGFLAGFYLSDSTAFEDWQLRQQERLRGQQAAALQRLVEIHEVWARYDQAIDYGRQWLNLDVLQEPVHRQLMHLFALAGQHQEALRQYERCRSVLERELGVSPDDETERLREQIASPRPPRGPDGQLDVRSGGLGPAPPVSGIPCFLFVRMFSLDEAQIAGLEERFREAIGAQRGWLLAAAGQTWSASLPTAAAAARVALSVHDRDPGRAAGLRMVLLAGEHPQQRIPSTDTANRAEHLLQAARPGQVLLDETTALAAAADPPREASVHDLGAHRLADLGPAQPIRQLEHPSLPQSSADLLTLSSCPNNLPTQPTPFIGREADLALVRHALRSAGVRLLTLTGAGGTGKTRLALQAAAGLVESFEHGMFFVDLAPLRDPKDVVGAIATALNLREVGGEGRSPFETLRDTLRARRVLLLLDNFEHLLPVATQVADLLAQCPQLQVIATSREALNLRVERVLDVPPMQLPSPGQRASVLRHCEAVRLFVDRAASVRPTFELDETNVGQVAEICIYLDGLPLAIELAATRAAALTPVDLLTRLQAKRSSLLEGGPRDLPQRQQALKTEIDWSHELLTPADRCLFRRLSVFAAGCTSEAAEAVCGADGADLDVLAGLHSLTAKSLLRLEEVAGSIRFRMLETIREYAWDRLEESGELEDLEVRFAAWCLDLAEQAEAGQYGSKQVAWFDRLDEDYGNLRAALGWLRDERDVEGGLRLAGVLGWYWFRRARFAEGRDWLELYREGVNDPKLAGPRAKAAYYLGWLQLCVGRSFWGNPEGQRFFQESLRLWRNAGDLRGVALSEVWLGWTDGVEGEEGWAHAEDSVALARETGDPWAIAWCLKVAYAHLRRPDRTLTDRRAALEEAIALARQTRDPFLLSQTMAGMGHVYSWIGELEPAEPWYLEALRIAREINDTWSMLDTINCLGDLYLGAEQIRRSKALFAEGLRLAMELSARSYLGWFVGGFYGVARYEGDGERAVRLGAFSEAILNPEGRFDPRLAAELGLSDSAAAAAWESGQRMTPEQAAAYALEAE